MLYENTVVDTWLDGIMKAAGDKIDPSQIDLNKIDLNKLPPEALEAIQRQSLTK